MIDSPGPLALVGSGEYTAAMNEVDRGLLNASGGAAQAHVVLIPTASALEPDMPQRWNDRGVAHFTALGAQVTPVLPLHRADAFDETLIATLRQATFFYFSGGNPQHIVEVWRDTPAWHTLVERWRAGAVLAGCSAGAMMLGGTTISIRSALNGQPPQWVAALDLIAPLTVLPHFDRILNAVDAVQLNTMLATAPTGTLVVGIDEDTALVHTASGWQVQGRRSVVVFDGATSTRYTAGDVVPLPPLTPSTG